MMVHDGLTCSFQVVHMVTYGSSTAKEFDLSRELQDNCAFRSHQKAIESIETGKFKEEIIPVEVPQRKGDSLIVDTDEGPRKDTSLEKLAKLRPVFGEDGTITAGNAPGVNDGACAFVRSEERRVGKECTASW